MNENTRKRMEGVDHLVRLEQHLIDQQKYWNCRESYHVCIEDALLKDYGEYLNCQKKNLRRIFDKDCPVNTGEKFAKCREAYKKCLD